MEYLREHPFLSAKCGFYTPLVHAFWCDVSKKLWGNVSRELGELEYIIIKNCSMRSEWESVLNTLRDRAPDIYWLLICDYILPYYEGTLRAKNRFMREHYLKKFLGALPSPDKKSRGIFLPLLMKMRLSHLWLKGQFNPPLMARALEACFEPQQIEWFILQLESLLVFVDACKE